MEGSAQAGRFVAKAVFLHHGKMQAFDATRKLWELQIFSFAVPDLFIIRCQWLSTSFHLAWTRVQCAPTPASVDKQNY